MKLDKYLRSIEECPEEVVELNGRKLHRLTTEFGIYDNWPILINADYNLVVEDFKKDQKWVYHGEGIPRTNPQLKSDCFHYVPGVIVLGIQNWVPFIDYSSNELHQKKQKQNFNMDFCLHPYQEHKEDWQRIRVFAITDIVNYLRNNNFPFCFPRSIGWRNREDNSQTVYWPDSLHDEITQSIGVKR